MVVRFHNRATQRVAMNWDFQIHTQEPIPQLATSDNAQPYLGILKYENMLQTPVLARPIVTCRG